MVGLYIGIGIGVLVLLGIGGYIWRTIKAKQEAQRIEQEQIAISTADLEQVQQILNSFISAIERLKGLGFICASQIQKIKEEWKPTYQQLKKKKYHRGTETYRIASDFIKRYTALSDTLHQWNKEFVVREKERCKALFGNIDGKSLDNQQQDVVVYDEDSTLVLAGAGSGKTLTIAAKVKYLCDEKKVNPEDILLVSFTRKAAEEMTERIGQKLGIPIQATTFHKLGLDIIKAAKNESIDVLEDIGKYVNQYFEEELMSQPETIKLLIEYFAYYLHIPADMTQFDTLGDVYAYEKGMDFETLKSKYNSEKTQLISSREKENRESKHTIKGEQVKSLEEVSIANFLFLNGIEYEYESKYEHQTNNANYKVYRPDFYLPQYQIYIEHFGINKQGRLPWLSPIEEQKYIEGMKWKREQHRANGTKLLETYSYYSSDGVLLKKLEELLRQNGVELKEIDFKTVFDTIYKTKSDAYFAEFKKLCCTFIVLFKSNGYKVSDIANLKIKNPRYRNPYFLRRTELYTLLIKPLIEGYDRYLETHRMIDFSDMINKAADAVNDGYKVQSYRYVIIDEYQDISVARYKLIKAILNQTKAKLLCVGDDWQSIYRFAGSDISLFTEFDKYFDGKCQVMKLERTYRNSQELINVAAKFIQSNPRQMKKQLVSGKNLEKPITLWMYGDNPFKSLDNALQMILANYDKGQSILLLGRTNYDSEMLDASGLFAERKHKGQERFIYLKSPSTPITFMTVHKAKGLEADNVILLNFQNSTLGFPNKIADDPMLELVLSDADSYLFGEERRLFYVAMTRTKNKFIILTDNNKPSVFFDELKSVPGVLEYRGDLADSKKPVECPRCKKGRLVVRKNEETNRYFLGCSNYPQCDYTYNDIKVLDNARKCPNCGGFMVLRDGQYGKFYGCSNYPRCRHTEEFGADYGPSNGRRRIGF